MAEGRPAYTRPQKELIIVASLCLVVGTLAVVFRMVSRRLFQAKVWWDDCLCVFGWVGGKHGCARAVPAVDKRAGRGLRGHRRPDSGYVEWFVRRP